MKCQQDLVTIFGLMMTLCPNISKNSASQATLYMVNIVTYKNTYYLLQITTHYPFHTQYKIQNPSKIMAFKTHSNLQQKYLK